MTRLEQSLVTDAIARAEKAEAERDRLAAEVEKLSRENVPDEGVLQEALERAFKDAHGLILMPHTGLVNILGRHMAHHIPEVKAEFAARAALHPAKEPS